jgi:hypothetical protein
MGATAASSRSVDDPPFPEPEGEVELSSGASVEEAEVARAILVEVAAKQMAATMQIAESYQGLPPAGAAVNPVREMASEVMGATVRTPLGEAVAAAAAVARTASTTLQDQSRTGS